MVESWKVWPQNENYEVSNLGRVRSKARWVQAGKGGKRWVEGKILKIGYNMKGYDVLHISFWDNKLKKDKKKSHSLHRVVAETFIPNPNNKAQVNHINGNKKDNRVENLEWVTMQENLDHARYELNTCKLVSLKQINELYESNPNMSLAEFVQQLGQLRR
jgi:hypothetical protein